MKPTYLAVACLLAFGTHAQAQQAAGANDVLEKANIEALTKDKDKSDKDITDAKVGSKASTWMDRAKTYQNIAGQYIRIDSAAATKAREAYNKVLELDKTKKGDPGRLAKEAQEALTGQAMYAAFMQQGVAKFQNKNYADAIKSMSIAGEINTKDTLAPLYTAIAAQQIKDNDVAKNQLEKYITAGGQDVTIYGSLAMLYRSDKDIDKALATLDKGIALDPKNKDLANERINIMLASNRMDDAIAGMKKMVEREPDNVQNLVNLGILYDNAARVSLDSLRKMDGGDRKGELAGKQLAEAKDLLQTYSGEVTRLSGLIKKSPKADLKRQLADVQTKLKEQKAEVARLEEEVKLAEASASSAKSSQQQMADLKQKVDQDSKMAIEYYSKALTVDPNNYDANYNLGVYYFNQAVEMKRDVDRMDMAEYSKRGKDVDGQVCGKFKQALPYFNRAKAVREEVDLMDNLTNLENVLKQYEGRKVVCVEPVK